MTHLVIVSLKVPRFTCTYSDTTKFTELEPTPLPYQPVSTDRGRPCNQENKPIFVKISINNAIIIMHL